MNLENEIKVEKHGEIIIMDIRGDITSYSEAPLKKSYHEDVDPDARKIIFKIEKEAYINSGGIALLIQILYETQENKQNVAIAGVSQHYRKIFDMVGITKFAKLCDTLEAAFESLDSKQKSYQ